MVGGGLPTEIILIMSEKKMPAERNLRHYVYCIKCRPKAGWSHNSELQSSAVIVAIQYSETCV